MSVPPGTRLEIPARLRESLAARVPTVGRMVEYGAGGSGHVGTVPDTPDLPAHEKAVSGGSTPILSSDLNGPVVQAAIAPPGNLPPTPAWVDPADVAYWDDKLAAARVRDPANHSEVAELLSNLTPPEAYRPHFKPLKKLEIHRAVQSFLDLLPGHITRRWLAG